MNAKVIVEYIEKLENQVDELKPYKTKCEELENTNEELKAEVEHLMDKLEQEIKFRQDNFKMIDEMEVYGLNESDFH